MEDWWIALVAVGAVAAVAMLAAAAVLLVRVVRAYRLLRSEDVPVGTKAAFWGAVVYTLFPLDLLPDPVYLDDIGLLAPVLHHLGKAARRYGRPPRDDL
ncbi:YkvA family protein [Streptomyces megasporus]|uniref:YkvA family protein n=1 Tax=Streptomyces megasporus TaxID=44060 RepID=UPI0004E14747|nr:YkvA family protein [Streptomyces megasporus]